MRRIACLLILAISLQGCLAHTRRAHRAHRGIRKRLQHGIPWPARPAPGVEVASPGLL